MTVAPHALPVSDETIKGYHHENLLIRHEDRRDRRGAALALLAAVALPATSATAASPAAPAPVFESSPVGFGAGTTGGAGGKTVTVNSLSSLAAAAAGDTPAIVRVAGSFTGPAKIKIGSNKTIIGAGSGATLTDVELSVDGTKNVIIRNLTIAKVHDNDGDAIHLVNGANHVWIDHTDLSSDLSHGKDYYDGLLDITHAADYITVSWNKFHDHYKVSLVGHSDSNGSEDTGHLRVTYSHNWFENVNSRLPSLRFGTGHAYNNYYDDVAVSAIHSRMGAQFLVQNNVFRNTKVCVTTTGDSKVDGYANQSGNDFGGCTNDITRTGTFTSPPYSFTLDPTSSVQSEVTSGAGAGKIAG